MPAPGSVRAGRGRALRPIGRGSSEGGLNGSRSLVCSTTGRAGRETLSTPRLSRRPRRSTPAPARPPRHPSACVMTQLFINQDQHQHHDQHQYHAAHRACSPATEASNSTWRWCRARGPGHHRTNPHRHSASVSVGASARLGVGCEEPVARLRIRPPCAGARDGRLRRRRRPSGCSSGPSSRRWARRRSHEGCGASAPRRSSGCPCTRACACGSTR